MRFIVLGGAGDIGAVAVKDRAAAPGAAEVRIGDLNLEKARELAAALGAPVTSRVVDISHREGLMKALAGCDVAVNCVGPFYKHGTKVLEACIGAKVNYVGGPPISPIPSTRPWNGGPFPMRKK